MEEEEGNIPSPCFIERLPPEVLLKIFDGFKVEELCSLSCVNRTFHSIANDDHLWVPLCSPSWQRPHNTSCKTVYMEWLRKVIRLYETVPSKQMRESHPYLADTTLKVLVLGDSGVGKTSLMYRWTTRHFSAPPKSNLGFDFYTRDVTLELTTYTIQVWDTAGQERFQSLGNAFYRGADGMLLVYDLNKMGTVDHLRDWIEDVKSRTNGRQITTVIAGNKTDLVGNEGLDSPTFLEADIIASEYGMPHTTCSAKEDCNVDETFRLLVRNMASSSLEMVALRLNEPLPRFIPSNETLERRGIIRASRPPPPDPPASWTSSACGGCLLS